jgi:ATPase components of various ABC-type transport systems, contain duplicated ATPase
VMVMQPELLILDEPTAQLDPIAASEFIGTLVKLNRELSLTIIIVEHRLEEIIPIADKLFVMEGGKLLDGGVPSEVAGRLRNRPELLRSMPSAVRLYNRVSYIAPQAAECPLTIRDGRRFIERNFGNKITLPAEPPFISPDEPALEFRDVFFKYGRELPDVLRGLNFTVHTGELFCLLGGNGSGKSTALAAAAGLIKPYSGELRIFGKKLRDYKNRSLYKDCLALLPQDVQTMFLCSTVRGELDEVGAKPDTLPFDLSQLYDKHPYDLSGGEAQLVGLAKVLAANPRLLLLDEPTKGIDADSRARVVELLKKLRDGGMTVVVVTHDVEFAAECGGRCALFFRGEITSCGLPRAFFSENNFYTTAINRMTRGHFNGAVTLDDAVSLCELNKLARDGDGGSL